jgi:hypothetical protein
MAKHKQIRFYFHTFRSLAAMILTIALSGCLQNGGGGKASSGGGRGAASSTAGAGGSSVSGTPAPISSLSYSINNLVVSSTGTGSGGVTNLQAQVFFDAANPANTATNVCTGAAGARPCLCRYSWTEINGVTGIGVTRSVDTDVNGVAPFNVTCLTPSVYQTEIPDGTSVRITVLPNSARGNSIAFTSNTWAFTKGSTMVTADFRDAEGRAIKNIMHYVCYDRFSKALTIARETRPGATRTMGPIPNVSLANVFSTSNVGYSAESYYYDFYVRNNEVGSINATNASFECPRFTVEKSGVNVQQYYPLDSQFALALQSSSDYPVSVTANIRLTTAGANPTEQGILGYAALPNADGSCPAITDSTGLTRRTFRLRRYTVTYPKRYLANGMPASGGQPSNQLYIIDRPVDRTGQDPARPLTRLGPKPCPFSLNTAASGYTCTTALPSGASAVNIDGTRIVAQAGCPVYPPPAVVNMPGGHLEIRPMAAWAPHYVEDADFRACAFQSSTPVDPDIVVVRDTGSTQVNYYCAKYYPSHSWLDPPTFGGGFNKMPSDCEASHPTWAAAQVNPPVGTAAAIVNNPTYACAFTYNPTVLPNGYDALAPASSLPTPTSGCCQRCSGNGCGAGAARSAAAVGTPALLHDHPRQSAPNPPSAGQWQEGCFDPSADP